MIVDDDKEPLEELQGVLVSAGYDVKSVNDPTLVLETVNKIRPDCILLDLKMPKKSGFQVADELRHISQVGDIPVIAVTAFFTEAEHSLLMNICGIKRCLKKPFNPTELIGEIGAALLNKRKNTIKG